MRRQPVFWAPTAWQDRLDIWDHIAADNPLAATQLDEHVSRMAEHLSNHPKLGKPGQLAGTRELIVHDYYRLAYELAEGTVHMLTLLHVARQWPPRR